MKKLEDLFNCLSIQKEPDLLDNISNEFVVKEFVLAGILKDDPVTPLFYSLLADEISISKYLILHGANLEGAVNLLRNELSIDEIKIILRKLNL